MHRDESYVMEALRNGAFGVVLKDSSVEEFGQGDPRSPAVNRRYLSPPLSGLRRGMLTYNGPVPTADPYNSLSSRERRVLQLAAEGHTNAAIGKRLFISPARLKSIDANMMPSSICVVIPISSGTPQARQSYRKTE
jgi:DNA-binding NarL/FixJ family response regulator